MNDKELNMSIQRRLARFNRVFANRVVGPALARLPGFGSLHHVGRVSGRSYRTPVKVFRQADTYVFSLPYGSDSDWVKNVLAAEGCVLVTGRRRIHLGDPQVYVAEEETAIPAPIRAILNRVKAHEYLALKPVRVSSSP